MPPPGLSLNAWPRQRNTFLRTLPVLLFLKKTKQSKQKPDSGSFKSFPVSRPIKVTKHECSSIRGGKASVAGIQGMPCVCVCVCGSPSAFNPILVSLLRRTTGRTSGKDPSLTCWTNHCPPGTKRHWGYMDAQADSIKCSFMSSRGTVTDYFIYCMSGIYSPYFLQ